MSSSATTPGKPTEDDFYDAAPVEPHLLYQGEVLVNVPILNMPMPTRWLLLRTKSGRRVDVALEYGNLGGLVKVVDSNLSAEEWKDGYDGDFAMARLSKRPAVVLSQTCDVQTKDFIQVAPLFPVPDDSYLERLKNWEIISAFWMKANPPDINGQHYADFTLIQSVHKSYIKRLRPEQHFRLKEEQTRNLQRSTTRYFGRPNSFDVESDLVPRTGTYLCVGCFYMNGIVTTLPRLEGEPFEFCSACKGGAWVLRAN